MNERKCKICDSTVQHTADGEPFCAPCGWIESKD